MDNATRLLHKSEDPRLPRIKPGAGSGKARHSRGSGNDGLKTTVGACGRSSLAVNLSHTLFRPENSVFCAVNARMGRHFMQLTGIFRKIDCRKQVELFKLLLTVSKVMDRRQLRHDGHGRKKSLPRLHVGVQQEQAIADLRRVQLRHPLRGLPVRDAGVRAPRAVRARRALPRSSRSSAGPDGFRPPARHDGIR